MKYTEELKAKIARLTAELDALESPPMSDAERWARAYWDAVCATAPDYWAEFDSFKEHRQRQCLAAMQPVIDGIRAEADRALASMTAQRDRLKLKVDSQREELKRWNDAHAMGPNQTRDKLVEQAQEIQTMTAERDALAARVQKVGVVFEVTEEELEDAWMASGPEKWAPFCFRYLAEHATVVTPGDVSGPYSAKELRGMLEDVVSVLDLSEGILEKHGPHGTPPADIVREVLAQKDKIIKRLEHGLVNVATVVTPGDLPSVEKLARIMLTATQPDGHDRWDAYSQTKRREYLNAATAVLNRLRQWLRPRTITRDQLYTAARVITTQRAVDENSTLADTARGITQDVFAAIGITVEGE